MITSMDELFQRVWRTLEEKGIEIGRMPSFEQIRQPQQLQDNGKACLKLAADMIQEWNQCDLKGVLFQAKQYIEEHYGKEISLESVSEHIRLSPQYVSLMFKKQYGMTFIDYLTRVRIEQAKRLVMDPSIPLKEVSRRVGYLDPNYFSRVFRKATGLPPSEYRARSKPGV